MDKYKVIEVKESIFANNDADAEKLRQELKAEKTFLLNLMSSPGAGKTTLLKAILNLIPYKGDITLDGEAITRKNIARLSFATCEHSFFPGLTANDHRDFYAAHFETVSYTHLTLPTICSV